MIMSAPGSPEKFYLACAQLDFQVGGIDEKPEVPQTVDRMCLFSYLWRGTPATSTRANLWGCGVVAQ